MPPNDDDRDEKDIQRQNLIAGVFVVALTLFGIWLVDAFHKHIQLEQYMEARHRNCVPLDLEDTKK